MAVTNNSKKYQNFSQYCYLDLCQKANFKTAAVLVITSCLYRTSV